MLDTVLSHPAYPVLFTAHEQRFLTKLRRLPQKSRCLFVRLYQRKGPWFRVDKLAYPLIAADLEPLFEVLFSEGLMRPNLSDADLPSLLPLLSTLELQGMWMPTRTWCIEWAG